MYVTCTKEGATTTIALDGRLSIDNADELADAVKTIDEDTDVLLFDLSELAYVSSAGLRVFMSAWKRMGAQDGTMRLCHPKPTVREVFALTGIDQVIEVTD